MYWTLFFLTRFSIFPLYIGEFFLRISQCIDNSEFLQTFPPYWGLLSFPIYWGLWFFTNFHLWYCTGYFESRRTFLLYWILWIFTNSSCTWDFEFLRFPPLYWNSFFNEFPPVLGTLSFYGFSLVPDTLSFDESPPFTGDFEFCNLPHVL